MSVSEKKTQNQMFKNNIQDILQNTQKTKIAHKKIFTLKMQTKRKSKFLTFPFLRRQSNLVNFMVKNKFFI